MNTVDSLPREWGEVTGPYMLTRANSDDEVARKAIRMSDMEPDPLAYSQAYAKALAAAQPVAQPLPEVPDGSLADNQPPPAPDLSLVSAWDYFPLDPMAFMLPELQSGTIVNEIV